jgi:trk system potassium uptake protein TrkH
LFDLRPVLHVFALCLMATGAFMAVPGLVEWGYRDDEAMVFVASAAIALFVGGALALTTRQHKAALSLRQAFLLTPLCWFGLPVFGALPFMFAETRLSFTDAYFETVSGFTTTGSTLIAGLDRLGHGILLWRALLHWLGGIGIVVVAVAILPFLKVGGMQIMRTESSDRSDKIMPRASQIASAIARVYLLLTCLCVIAYSLAGMTFFDAVAHAMSTIATGGFSTSDVSIGNYSLEAQWVAIAFMLLGALPFVLMVRAFQGAPGALWRDSQVRAFFGFLSVVIAATTLWIWSAGSYGSFGEALHHVALNVVSVVTTTGFASTDYQLWGTQLLPLFFFLTLVGGCTGSTTGAVKIFRWQIIWLEIRYQLAQAIQPHRAIPRRYNGKPLPADVPGSVGLFLFLFLASIVVFTGALAATGLDFVTALTGATTALANVGPGLGPMIGPAGNFVGLSDTATWLLSFAMVMGRLELLTVFVLLDWRFWRR